MGEERHGRNEKMSKSVKDITSGRLEAWESERVEKGMRTRVEKEKSGEEKEWKGERVEGRKSGREKEWKGEGVEE